MKKLSFKTIGTLVACVGTVAAMSSAFALYWGSAGKPADVSFGIGAHTTTDVTLTATENADDKNLVKPSINRVYDFTLGFNTASGSLYGQNVYLGKVTVTITASTNAFADALASSTLAIGTVSETPEYTGFWAQAAQQPAVQHEAETKTVIFSGHYPIYKTGVKCRLTIGLGSVTDATYLSDCAEQTYTVAINFAEPDSTYKMCYVRGPWGWTNTDQGLMVPNPKAPSNYEWMYDVSNTSTDPNYIPNEGEYKCFSVSENDYESFTGNHKWDSSKTTIYWSGSTSDPSKVNA